MGGNERLVNRLVETIRFGSDDPRIVALALAIVAVIVGLAIVLVLLVQLSWRRSDAAHPSGLPLRSRGSGSGLLIAVAVLGSVALLFVAGASYLARPEVCGSCHDSAQVSAAEAVHAGVSCVDCHRQPGALGFALGQVDYARWAVASARGEEATASSTAEVTNRACLRCHDDVGVGVVENDAMRVRHADFMDRPCVGCHASTGHGGRSPGQQAIMNTCLSCHDARQVSSECMLCHVGDVARVARRTSPRPAPVKVAAPTGTDCRGCHEVESCNECHGVEMPHQPGWMPGHARVAFTQPDVCWRCHPSPEFREDGPQPYAMCNECHRFPGPHGLAGEWVSQHGAAAAKAPGVFGRTRCGLCHTNERFCDLCHEGRQEKVDYR